MNYFPFANSLRRAKQQHFAAKLPTALPLFTLALLLVAPQSVSAADNDVVGIEESWELVVRDPDPISASPQISTAFSPIRDDDILYAALSMNHYQHGDDFVSGGLQLQLWYGESLLGQKTSDKRALLSKPGEKITWTQTISVNSEGLMTFCIKDGQSDTWGQFGSTLSLQVWTNLRNLNDYQPNNSVKSSGMVFGGNRVQSHKLTKVRVIFQSGESKTLTF